MPKLYALVDCNNFYASCERAFNPSLIGRPVVVLSNNDGCIIARSAEAKALGISMAKPYFQSEPLIKKHGVAVFSSNYALYGDMSARVMSTLGQFSPDMEMYSIDEAFLDLTGFPEVEAYARTIRATVRQWTGIPVSIGLGPTKTLAKIANRLAKSRPELDGALDISRRPDLDALLESIQVGDVWGIGRRYAAMLTGRGIHTARAFRDLPRDFVRKTMTVGGLHTLLELRGVPCLDLEHGPPPKKAIVSSRSFGRPVTLLHEMREALAEHVNRAAGKLRAQDGLAGNILAFVQTNRFIKGEPQYAVSETAALPVPTADAAELIRAGHGILDRIFKSGFRYKKTGVMLFGIERRSCAQGSLLAPPPEISERKEALMQAMDGINAKWGRTTLRPAACGLKQTWSMRQEKRSPRFTTVWTELPVAKATTPRS